MRKTRLKDTRHIVYYIIYYFVSFQQIATTDWQNQHVDLRLRSENITDINYVVLLNGNKLISN